MYVFPRPADRRCSSLESYTRKACKWLRKPENTVACLHTTGVPACGPPTPPRWTANMAAQLLWFPPWPPLHHKLSNTMKHRKCHQRDFLLSYFSTKMFGCYATSVKWMIGLFVKGQVSTSNKGGDYGGVANNIISLHSIQNSSTHL